MADRSPGEPASPAVTAAPVEQSWFKALAEHAPYFFGLATLEGKMLFVNRAGLAMIGRENEDPRSLTIASMLSSETWAWTRDEKLPALREKGFWTGETVLVHRDGHTIPVQQVLVLLRGEDGQPARMATILQDMTPQKQLEQALREAIRSMSTPILQVWDGVLALPVIGMVDGERAAHMTEALLDAIPRHGCRVAILDLTGMETLDTSTLEHLLRMVRAAGLLGSRCVISGISAAAAQAITGLGVDLSGFATFRSLREALSHAIRSCQHGGD